LALFGGSTEHLRAFVFGAFRCLPTALLLPALGLGPASLVVRLALTVALALSPTPTHGGDADGSLILVAGAALVDGIPMALVSATSLWAAFMAGDLMGWSLRLDPDVGGGMRMLFGVLACAVFLELGGLTAVAERLSAEAPDSGIAGPALVLARGIGVAVQIAGPLLIARVLVDLVSAAALRAEPAGALRAMVLGAGPMVMLLATALLFERMAELVVLLER
jgi:hypothetical protein